MLEIRVLDFFGLEQLPWQNRLSVRLSAFLRLSLSHLESNRHLLDTLHKVRLHVNDRAIELHVIHAGKNLLQHHLHFHLRQVHAKAIVTTYAK